MPVKTAINPIELDLVKLIPEELSSQAKSKTLAEHARTEIANARAHNDQVLGRSPDYDVYVDGRKGAALETVKPDGKIVAEFDLIVEMFEWIDDMLLLNSPVGTERPPQRWGKPRPGHPGLYQRSHMFLVDDEEKDPRSPVGAFDEATFVSSVPYARKIERGLSSQATSGVYQVVAAMASKKYHNYAYIYYSLVIPPTGLIHEWANDTSLMPMRHGRPRRISPKDRSLWLRRQPAIIIRARSS